MLFLTARDALTDRLSGFHAGGDDYLTKPFVLAELLVRVHALQRRGPAQTDEAANGRLLLDPAAHAIVTGDGHVPLTPTEFRLRGRPALHADLLAALAARPGVHDNTLDAYLARIRRKLREAEAPQAVHTTRGVGYELR